MLNFESDYTQGAHPEILNKLFETNFEHLTSYGLDKYSDYAKNKIKALCNKEDAQVFLLSGGTQTNQIVIDTMLHSTEGIICADSGHINVHEAGAIEFSGHKTITIENDEGKIYAKDVESIIKAFYADESHTHCVYPGMVYISHPTEYGTLYTKKELEELAGVCRKNNIPLYLDGARLGYGLMSSDTDVTIEDIAEFCDVFYIGGTKVGALCGEAVVFTHGNAPKRFFTSIKQHGALLAKGRLLGIQFYTLFKDDLYFRVSEHANKMADKIRQALEDKNYEIFIKTSTNQIFVVLCEENIERLKKHIAFTIWEHLFKDLYVVRLATSWATTESDINELIKIL